MNQVSSSTKTTAGRPSLTLTLSQREREVKRSRQVEFGKSHAKTRRREAEGVSSYLCSSVFIRGFVSFRAAPREPFSLLPWLLAGLLGAAGLAQAAEQVSVDPAKELPRVPPTEPRDAVEKFQIRKGFRIELAAHEPNVADPIALCFDENGRLFVIEMRDYSERRDERLGRIRLLEDANEDGFYEKSTVFADDLPWPTALFWANGGLLVGATPDIFFFKDTNGDGRADEKKLLFTGFGSRLSRLNVQQLFNSLNWSLDNRIHGAAGANGGWIKNAASPDQPELELKGDDFSIDPRDWTMRIESGGGQYGLTFDNRGRKYVCSNSSHLLASLYEHRYASLNPLYAPPPPTLDIPVDGGAAPVYRISPDEPWRVIRTRWRVAGMVPGPIEGGGRPSGYFTGATGVTLYRGDAWPPEYQGDVFTADAGSNLIHRKKIHENGAAVIAKRPDDEQQVEFLASPDNWFRPVQMANGPDGAFYVIDMYREVIEHPWSLPEPLKKHLDLNSGNDRGRIYRIVPVNFKRPPTPKLGRAGIAELVKTLEHPNGWQRDTAARLLYERQDQKASSLLEQLLAESKADLGRMHALYTLQGLKALRENHLWTGLNDRAGAVREHAVRLLEGFWNRLSPAARAKFWPRLVELGDDNDPRVRRQLAFSLSAMAHPEKPRLLAKLWSIDPARPWMEIPISIAVANQAFETLSELVKRYPQAPPLSSLYQQIARQGNEESWQRVLAVVEQSPGPAQFESAAAFLDELARTKKNEAFLKSGSVRAVLQKAAAVAGAETNRADPNQRAAAVSLLAHANISEHAELLQKLLQPTENELVQVAAVKALLQQPGRAVYERLFTSWPGLAPRLKSLAIDRMLQRPESALALLEAVQRNQVVKSELSPAHRVLLSKHPNARVKKLSEEMFAAAPSAVDAGVVRRYTEFLGRAGNHENGRRIFVERCVSCHQMAGEGAAVGPDLVTVRSAGREQLLVNILDPNREVASKYVSYLVETKDGEVYLGVVVNETPESITLKLPQGQEVQAPRKSIAKLQTQEKSLMPEGLHDGLTPEAMNDLIEFILNAAP